VESRAKTYKRSPTYGSNITIVIISTVEEAVKKFAALIAVSAAASRNKA
jgi:hypothetical protein